MDYWVDTKGDHAIWSYAHFWLIGQLSQIGSFYASIATVSSSIVTNCPYNEVLSWQYMYWYHDGTYLVFGTNDVYINCDTEDDFCTSENPCGTYQGDCDAHEECQDDLICISNNCPDSLGFDSEFDCCHQRILGDEHYCASGIPCGENEGDCDYNSECQSNHFCGSNNCPTSLGFDSAVDCCSSTQIMSPNYPNLYPNNAYETWQLTHPTASFITLQFHSFNVRHIVECEIINK